MKSEFDYQWKNLPSECIEYNGFRVREFNDFTGLPPGFLKGKHVLDAGCGNGRYTYAMQKLGATVTSIDISSEAVKACLKINPNTRKLSILDVGGKYDFILSWGVLHHMEDPHAGFLKLTSTLKLGGTIHLMLYNKNTQNVYIDLREKFKTKTQEEKVAMCKRLGNVHGWYDALNPEYNHSYEPDEIVKWYEDAGFRDIKVMPTASININGVR